MFNKLHATLNLYIVGIYKMMDIQNTHDRTSLPPTDPGYMYVPGCSMLENVNHTQYWQVGLHCLVKID